MIPFAAGLGAGDPSIPLHTVLAEPVSMAVGWVQQPPWVIVALVLVTMAVLHIQSTIPCERPRTA